MIKLTKLFLMFSFLMLTPADIALADMSVEKVTKKVESEYDRNNKIFYLTGPKIKTQNHDPYFIHTSADDEHKQIAVHFLVVEYDFIKSNPGRKSGYVMSAESAYKNFTVATDDFGNEFELTTIKRDFDGCNDSFCYFDEYFKIKITQKYFSTHMAEGIRLRAHSKSGTYMDFYLYPAYLRGIQQRLDQERARIGN